MEIPTILQDFDKMCFRGENLPLRSVQLEICLMELNVGLQKSERNLGGFGGGVLFVPQYIFSTKKAPVQMRSFMCFLTRA